MLNKNFFKSAVIGLVVVALVYGFAYLLITSPWANADNAQNDNTNSLADLPVDGNTITASFAVQSSDNANVFNETISTITGTGNWRSNSAILPFKKNSIPVRYSSPGNLPKNEWGSGQYTRLYPGNSYVPGQCTWYSYNRRYELGRPVGAFWGDGGGWHISAASAGYLTNHTPEVGAVVDLPHHVAIVEEIGIDNSIHVSEMNYLAPYNYNERWITDADTYWYIH